MQLNYADMLTVTESVRRKIDNAEFTKLERDTIIFALGLLSARAPGKLEPKIEAVTAVVGVGGGGYVLNRSGGGSANTNYPTVIGSGYPTVIGVSGGAGGTDFVGGNAGNGDHDTRQRR